MIPVNEPVVGEAELAHVVEAVRSGQISSLGPCVAEFEERWASYCGRRHGIAVCNGTVALQLAVACLDLEPGDEVVIPTFTIISCALAVVRAGGVPKLVDAEPRTWCLDVDAAARAITPRTRAVMPVHIYGHPAAMDPILDQADRHGLAVIEDAAEAHGAQYLSQRPGAPMWYRCGSFGTVSCFSFYANKLVTSGEGGMLVCDDDALAARARRLRNLAFEPGRRFHHSELGFNFRMTSIQAALALPQIARMDEIVAKKRWIGAEYSRRLADVRALQLPVEEPWARSVYWMYGVVVDERTELDAAEVARRLVERGVETRPFFLGMHEQEAFRRRGLFAGERYPVADRLARQGLYLPSGLGLTLGQLEQVVDAVREALR